MPKEKQNPWPRSIAAFLIAATFLLTWTIIKTSQMPVHEENSFMTTYQDVDMNADTIYTQSQNFLRNYDILLVSEHENRALEQEFYKKRGMSTNVIKPWEEIELQLVDSEGNFVQNGNLEVLLSRPTMRIYDKEVDVKYLGEGKFSIGRINFEKPGRWQLVVKATVDELIGFKNIELYIE